MQYQKNWERPKKIENPKCVMDWYKTTVPYPDSFKHQCFTVELIYPLSTKFTKVETSGDVKQTEMLKLIFKILDDKGNDVLSEGKIVHIEVPMYVTQRVRKAGEPTPIDEIAWFNNSVQSQDFMSLAMRQYKGEEDMLAPVTFRDKNDNPCEVYPNLCGTRYRLLATVKDKKIYGNKEYDDNEFALFALDGHSELELEENVKAKNDIKLTMEQFEKDYQDYCKKYSIEENAPSGYVSEPIPEPTAQAEPVEDDGLPF